MRDRQVSLVSPTAAAAREAGFAVARRLPDTRLVPLSLSGFARDPRAPLRIVLCPEGVSTAGDVGFLREARRTILWPSPVAEVWSAIAGLRGSHDAPPGGAAPTRGRWGRRSVLLLEGDVTLERARRAALSGAPRDWIVERVQRVRIPPTGLEELRQLGIRWAALDPVEVVALVASPALARERAKWARLLPGDIAIWRLPRSSRSGSRSSK